ncbi:hypothetical protein EV175_005767 [Coemansia sp. RSA 1933]|nr:hypothetical protein EV175_005767 [Coemansia sp. RSA 1933]
MLLPANSGDGVQSVTWRLKGFQQLMVESHCAISQATRNSTLAELDKLGEEVKKMLDSYVEATRPTHEALEQCKQSIRKRSELLEVAIEAARDPQQRRKETVKDPFIINLEVEALLRKRAELENRLYSSSIAQQIQIKEFESRLIDRLSAVVSDFMELVSARHKRLRQSAKSNVRSLGMLDAGVEWSYFSSEFEGVLDRPQSTHGNASAGDYEYPSKDSDWVRVLRQGVVALKEQGPLFRSTWQSKYGVLTTRGYFHVFRSQGDVVRGAPETSVFLPRARITMVRSGTLQISSGSRFNRCRIIIQDGTASLDNWRLLMESACYRNTDDMQYSVEPGLATPETSADESSDRASEPSSSSRRAAGRQRPGKAKSSGKRTPDAQTGVVGQIADDVAATPTRRGRPFSVDASMLAQTPLGHGQFGRPVSFTPTQDIYLQPLSTISGAATDTPLNRHGAFAAQNLSPIPNVSDITGLGSYSPDFTDSSGRDDMALGNATPASSRDGSGDAFGDPHAIALDSTNSSSSSGVPHRPASLFERSMAHGSDTAPTVGCLPRLRKRRSSAALSSPVADSRNQARRVGNADSDIWDSGGRHPLFTPMRASRSDAGFDQGILGWGSSGSSSIVNLQHARPYSSSGGYIGGGFRGASSDIWSSDVLSIPDPAAARRSSGAYRQRPRSMIHQPSSRSDHAALDPANPYLGEFLASRPMRSTRADSCTSTVCAAQPAAVWRSSALSSMSGSTSHQHRAVSQPASAASGKASPPLQMLLSVGPCPPIVPDSHDSIPEAAFEFDDTCG